MTQQNQVQATRRAVVCAACAVPLLAACGGGDPGASAEGTRTATGTPSADPSKTPSTPKPQPKPSPSKSRTPTSAASSRSPAGPTSTAPAPKPSAKPTVVAPPAGALVKVSAVPVGGGVVLGGDDIVVTQPSAGTFRGFSTTCTHKGCDVNRVSGGDIACPCHGSRFSIVDGSVTNGPASKPLAGRAVTVRSDWVCKA